MGDLVRCDKINSDNGIVYGVVKTAIKDKLLVKLKNKEKTILWVNPKDTISQTDFNKKYYTGLKGREIYIKNDQTPKTIDRVDLSMDIPVIVIKENRKETFLKFTDQSIIWDFKEFEQ